MATNQSAKDRNLQSALRGYISRRELRKLSSRVRTSHRLYLSAEIVPWVKQADDGVTTLSVAESVVKLERTETNELKLDQIDSNQIPTIQPNRIKSVCSRWGHNSWQLEA